MNILKNIQVQYLYRLGDFLCFSSSQHDCTYGKTIYQQEKKIRFEKNPTGTLGFPHPVPGKKKLPLETSENSGAAQKQSFFKKSLTDMSYTAHGPVCFSHFLRELVTQKKNGKLLACELQ